MQRAPTMAKAEEDRPDRARQAGSDDPPRPWCVANQANNEQSSICPLPPITPGRACVDCAFRAGREKHGPYPEDRQALATVSARDHERLAKSLINDDTAWSTTTTSDAKTTIALTIHFAIVLRNH